MGYLYSKFKFDPLKKRWVLVQYSEGQDEKEEKQMDIQINNIRDERAYLDARLYDAFSDKKIAAKRQFGMIDDKSPKDDKEKVERILAGKYTLVTAKEYQWGGAYDSYIRWRDPAMKEDPAGYEAAKAALQKLYQNAKDEIRVKPPVDGLEALRTFESATIN